MLIRTSFSLILILSLHVFVVSGDPHISHHGSYIDTYIHTHTQEHDRKHAISQNITTQVHTYIHMHIHTYTYLSSQEINAILDNTIQTNLITYIHTHIHHHRKSIRFWISQFKQTTKKRRSDSKQTTRIRHYYRYKILVETSIVTQAFWHTRQHL
jgi:hypothetical protein